MEQVARSNFFEERFPLGGLGGRVDVGNRHGGVEYGHWEDGDSAIKVRFDLSVS